MRIKIYEKHCREIEKITNEFVVPAIREAVEVITSTPKVWYNWGNREIKISEKLSINVCVDTRYSGVLSNFLKYFYAQNKSIGLNPPGFNWEDKYNECAVAPESEIKGADYRSGTIANIVGELRKFDKNSFLTEIENDAYDY